MGFYLDSVDRPNTSRIVSSDVVPGEIGAMDGSGGAEPFDFASHAEEDLLGVADKPRTGQHVAYDIDDSTDPLYQASENDLAPFGGEADRDHIKVRTAGDTGGNEAAPSISDGTVVGIIDTSAGTLTSTGEYQGRIVEEGYTDGESTPTTYNRSNNNFYPLGVALKDSSSSFDDVVTVEVNRDL